MAGCTAWLRYVSMVGYVVWVGYVTMVGYAVWVGYVSMVGSGWNTPIDSTVRKLDRRIHSRTV